ncbi:uncharacterized protein CTRU02_214846 [Colletotrichum truncatum]|uniref:Uncharacterized protein n=1 Tax=Colletotrichum truncatum TaxID=5467 RepID=A0ACC3YDV9_COLTU|nr:uncharacterized protein CTRU02_08399 [Colletotrichum truncatum]KAF6790270.1 hypothetical protein CTRU02_08399 [Colletotrichum truncatum]
MKTILLFLLVSQVLGQWTERWVTGAGLSEPRWDNRSLEDYRSALRNPNATRSITLKPWQWARGNVPRLDRLEWTWRVNITNIALPSLASVFPDVSDPHLVSTTYDFSWTGGGNLSQPLHWSTSPFCITTMAANFVFPPNVTNLYNESNSDMSDCEAIIGSDCRSKLNVDGNNLRSVDRCAGPQTLWSDISECNATFGYASQANLGGTNTDFGLLTFDINQQPNNSSLRNEIMPISSGDGFFQLASGILNGSDAAEAYRNATHGLQFIMFNTWIDIVNGQISRPNVLCMRVNATTVPSSAALKAYTVWGFGVVIITIFSLVF